MLAGYNDYAAQNPAADFSRLGEYFLAYLESDAAKADLAAGLKTLLEQSGLSVTTEQIETLVTNVMAGYQAFVEENGLDPNQFEQNLALYLDTPEAQQRIAEGAAGIMASIEQVNITQEQLEALACTVLKGYSAFAEANGYTDPAKIGEYFLGYLATEPAQKILGDALTQMIDFSGVNELLAAQMQSMQEQLAQAISQGMQQAMQQVMARVMPAVMQQVMSALTDQVLPAVMTQVMTGVADTLQTTITDGMSRAMTDLGDALQNAFEVDPDAFADAIQVNMTEEELTELLMSLMSGETASYEGNLRSLNYADPADPSSISIYPTNFESKEEVIRILDAYNDRMQSTGQEEKVIRYTDIVGTLMSSVTDIINIISYVLVAFVAISLIVSSIMIGVITYISVLERKKEIGILRAIGASKSNVSQVFNAETFIVGLCAGLIGIGLTLLLLIPGNAIIHSVANSDEINAMLPAGAAAVLVLLSVVLTLIGGLIPSRKAAKQDPVTALRTE